MKKSVVAALVTGGFALLYFFISEMRKGRKIKQSSVNSTAIKGKYTSENDSAVIFEKSCNDKKDNFSQIDVSVNDAIPNDKTTTELLTEVKMNLEDVPETLSIIEELSESTEVTEDNTDSLENELKCDAVKVDFHDVIVSIHAVKDSDLEINKKSVEELCEKDLKSKSQMDVNTTDYSVIVSNPQSDCDKILDDACELKMSNLVTETKPDNITKENSEIKVKANASHQVCDNKIDENDVPIKVESKVVAAPKAVELQTNSKHGTKNKTKINIHNEQNENSVDATNENEKDSSTKNKKSRRRGKKKDKSLTDSPSKDKKDDTSCSIAPNMEGQVPPKNYCSPDLSLTSDYDREASPEQENLISDSQSLISQASVDSGQGSIENEPENFFSSVAYPPGTSDQYMFYQFEIPQFLVGRLIGRKGTFVNRIKAATNVTTIVVDHKDPNFKLCSLEGYKHEIAEALKLIRKQFPLNQFSEVTLEQLNTPAPSPVHQAQLVRQSLQVELPAGIVIETQSSSVGSAGEIWLQQPLHPTFSSLGRLHHCLNTNYGDGSSTPFLPTPVAPTTVCVCKIQNSWFRCQVLSSNDGLCFVTLLDIGGFIQIPTTELRQIRTDYMDLPFQAAHCFLYGLQPPTDEGWTVEGQEALEQIAKENILHATICAYSQDGTPFVNLYRREFNEYVYVNKELVDLHHARWLLEEDSSCTT